jgi:hypothetical protein
MVSLIGPKRRIIYLGHDEKNYIRLIPATQYEVVPDPHEDYVSEIMEGQRRRLRYTTKLVLQTQKHHIKSYEDA